MEECFNCGAKIDKVRLFDAISDEGVVKICEKCSKEEHIPIIRRPTTFQLKEAERKQSFYEKATISLGKRFEEKEAPEKRQQEVTLREIVDRNYKRRVPKEKGPRPEMIDNFHWIIMRARRMKKLTQAQLAKEIEESEAAIRMAEQGVLPEDDYRLVNKLENYLGIKIVRPEFESEITPKVSGRLSFSKDEAKILTIDDLRKMKEEPEFEEEENIEEEDKLNLMNKIEETDDTSLQNVNAGEISKEEMDRILFGK